MALAAGTDPPFDAEGLLERALGFCRTGRFSEAQSILRRILEAQPNHCESLHFLGMVCSQLGNHSQAIHHIDAAIRIDAQSADIHNSRGNVLAALKRLDEALASFDTAIALDPHSAVAFTNRGNAHHELGQFERAVADYEKAIALDPDDAEARYGRGNALMALKAWNEALASFDKAIALRHDYVEARTNRGFALQELQRFDEALASYDGAIALKPDFSEAHNNRGLALQKLQRFDEALASFDRAIALRPDFAQAWNNRGAALQELKRFEEAVASFDKALAARPASPEAFGNRGNALQKLNRFEAAVESYERAIALKPDDAESLFYRGNALQELGRFDEAVASYDKAIALKPEDADPIAKRGDALAKLKRQDEALASFERALAIEPDNPHALGGMTVCAGAACDWRRTTRLSDQLITRVAAGELAIAPFTFLGYCSNPALHLLCARKYIDHHIPDIPQPLCKGRIWRHDKIRLAYVGSGFNQHPMAYLTAELFELHDRSRFEVLAVSTAPEDGREIRAGLIRAFDGFHDVGSTSDSDVASLMNRLEVDIAVDRSGYISHSRPGIFARRPAPIQVSYLGFPGTLGNSFTDYVIADPIVLPFDQQAFYTEKIVHLPDCYQVNDSKRTIAPGTPARAQAGLPVRGFVFCCFNNNCKIAPAIFDVWMRLLRRIDGVIL